MDDGQKLLEIAEVYFKEVVAHKANIIDSESAALREALNGLGERNLLALRLGEISDVVFRLFQEMAARYSGALAFLQTQHQSAGGMIFKSENEALKAEFLPHLASGNRLVGVGFSQLRRLGYPLLKALPVPGGYELNGFIPWITGFDFFGDFISGAMLPDGRAVFGMMPFKDSQQNSGGKLILSKPMDLVAMASTNTVSAEINHWFLEKEKVLFVKPAGWIQEQDKNNVLHHSFFALGCAKSALDIIKKTAKFKDLPIIWEALKALDGEFNNCRSEIFNESAHNGLQLRAWAIDLASRCATAAVTVSGGAANHKDHAAQRVYREALVFTVSGQTTAVMEATLCRLVR
ncbi:MAG TPA: acyl-CoA dehydrogenase family protein [Halomicronema sp.]